VSDVGIRSNHEAGIWMDVRKDEDEDGILDMV